MKTAQILADRAFLVERFPNCFVAKGQPKRPLQVGIHAEMQKRGILPDRRLRAFLVDYCRGPNYHEAVARGGPRYRLDGSEAGVVDKTSQHQAVTVLGQIRAASLDRAELKVLREALGDISRMHRDFGGKDELFRNETMNLIDRALAWRSVNDPASARGSSAPGSKEPESLSGGERAPDQPPASVVAVCGAPDHHRHPRTCELEPNHLGLHRGGGYAWEPRREEGPF